MRNIFWCSTYTSSGDLCECTEQVLPALHAI
uniref:Uncharacterized protein n=1 Tax=Anguilla anguilla TaxID=7936 RepID=A0A0E9Y1W3_ANGAN